MDLRSLRPGWTTNRIQWDDPLPLAQGQQLHLPSGYLT